MRTLIKNVFATTEKDLASERLKEAVGIIDRLATKRIIHPNTAARKKARLTKYVNNL